MEFDVDDVKEAGLDLGKLSAVAEHACLRILNMPSPEAEWLRNHLQIISDECEKHQYDED